MQRIVLIALCGTLCLIAGSAEARGSRRNSGAYMQPMQAVTAYYSPTPAQPIKVAATPAAPSVKPTHTSLSTSTAQGVANIMASTGTVGHWGGNPGYEGCGCGATPAAAYNCCCYSNSGMATVDVGYARGRNGMWFCCRRYR